MDHNTLEPLFSDATSAMRSDFKHALTAVSENGMNLEFVSSDLKNNRKIVCAAISSNPDAIEFASIDLRNDSEIREHLHSVLRRMRREANEGWHKEQAELSSDEESVSLTRTRAEIDISNNRNSWNFASAEASSDDEENGTDIANDDSRANNSWPK
ncbi:MAG: DUF4116 domain-containing protein [Legionella sp.]|nr:DUF4116 domain-containing protein [Legionella sp.]